jgi:hypothetical protein
MTSFSNVLMMSYNYLRMCPKICELFIVRNTISQNRRKSSSAQLSVHIVLANLGLQSANRD